MSDYKNKTEIMNRVHKHKDTVKHKGQLFGIFLVGSQNYSLTINDPKADIDTRAIFIPTFEDLCLNKSPINQTITLDGGEQVDCKDIRHYVHLLKKMNINDLETLFTDYYYINPKYEHYKKELNTLRERIARANPTRALLATMGMSIESGKLLTKVTPSTEHIINTHGFNGKRLSYIIRLSHFARNYINGLPFNECLTNNESEYLRRVKRNEVYTKDIAIHLATEYINEITFMAKNYPNGNIDTEIDSILDNFLITLFKNEYGIK